MTDPERRPRGRARAVALIASICMIPALAGSASGDGLSQIQNKLGTAQSRLTTTKQLEQALASKVAKLNRQAAALAGQIALVESREASERTLLATYKRREAADRAAIARERRHLAALRMILSRSQTVLAADLVTEYEQPQPSIVSLIVDAGNFQKLLDGIEYVSSIKRHEESVINRTLTAKAGAEATTAHLAALRRNDAADVHAAASQSEALQGMNALLDSRKSALADERAAQSAALAASKTKGSKLLVAISTIQKEEASAEQAARQISYGGSGVPLSAGWAIPISIVLCESGGQDLPPNSAGASGYYQIIPSTWRGFGGRGPAAYLAPKAEQDEVASRIWNHGAGARNWVCAGIVGIT
jgi:hypothetical protein